MRKYSASTMRMMCETDMNDKKKFEEWEKGMEESEKEIGEIGRSIASDIGKIIEDLDCTIEVIKDYSAFDLKTNLRILSDSNISSIMKIIENHGCKLDSISTSDDGSITFEIDVVKFLANMTEVKLNDKNMIILSAILREGFWYWLKYPNDINQVIFQLIGIAYDEGYLKDEAVSLFDVWRQEEDGDSDA